ncbi:MAG TPA: CHRD domain-containing protein [Longimicrobiaceae bacterium]|nr:CHRD domain-containing protein [Longimicrobiaceae bacterium]
MNTQRISLAVVAMLWACTPADQPKSAEAAESTDAAPAAAAASTTSAAPAAQLDASRGKEIGMVYEAYLSPWQEGDEESATPKSTPSQFRSTGTSLTRAQREAAGHTAHGQLRFTRDLSRAYVDVQVKGVDLANVNMFHIHCGRPGILGPIVVDFSQATNVKDNLADGTFSVELTDGVMVKTSQSGEGAVGVATMGCVIPSPSLGSQAPVKYSTIAGLARLAHDGELYFNLHTTGQTYYGDIRGQLLPAGT